MAVTSCIAAIYRKNDAFNTPSIFRFFQKNGGFDLSQNRRSAIVRFL